MSADLFLFLAGGLLMGGIFGPSAQEEGQGIFRIAGLVVYVFLSFKTAVSKSQEGTQLFYWLVPSLILGPLFYLFQKWKWLVHLQKHQETKLSNPVEKE